MGRDRQRLTNGSGTHRAGPVTFLVADIEDSSPLWRAAPEAIAERVRAHEEIVSEAVVRAGGVRRRERVERDRIVAAFARPADALAAALEAQLDLVRERPEGLDPDTRMALHTDTSDPRFRIDDERFAPGRRRCTRLCMVARGGQLVLSDATRELIGDRLPQAVELDDLGVRRLPDLGLPERVHALIHPDLPSPRAELRSLDTLPNNLPDNLNSFIGRERELAEVCSELETTRLLTLTGAGGCGKSRLALHSAAEMLARFPDGIWRVELTAITDARLVGQALASALGVRPLLRQSALDAVTSHLRARRALIVMDNCEHLLEGAGQVAEALLRECPEVRVLATSRARLGLPAETVWRVPSLAESEAVQLFVERASRVEREFEPTDGSAAALADVCSKLDGMPLAIELAAARAPVLSIEQIAAGLSNRFHLLAGPSRANVPRHRTLRASIDWSHELLTDEERRLFRRLAVFAGGFTIDAVESVAAFDDDERSGALDALAGLVDKSLVTTEAGGRAARYRLLETVREYASEHLSAAGEVAAARDHHRDFFLELAERVAPELNGAEAPTWHAMLDGDAANLKAALQWAIETDVQRALRMCFALAFWWSRGRYVDTDADADVARALAAAGPEPSSLRARVLWARAYLGTWLGRYEETVVLAQQALADASEVGDALAMARAHWVIGTMLQFVDPVGGRRELERAAELARTAGDNWSLASALHTIASTHLICAELDEAERALEESYAPFESNGSAEFLPWYWGMKSYPFVLRGDSARVLELCERALAACRTDEPTVEGMVHVYVAMVELAQGDAQRVVERLEASRKRMVASGHAVALGITEAMLAGARAALGDVDGALARLERVVASGLDGGWQLGWATTQLADILRVAGDMDRAEEKARDALAVGERIKAPENIAWSNEILGRVATARGEWSEAETLLHKALATKHERGMRLRLPQTLDALAELAAGLSADEEAARLLGAAERALSDMGFVRWAPDEPHLEALADELRTRMGAAAFAMAWDEGVALTLDEAVAWVRRARGSRRRPPAGWESLTPTELDVTRRAAAGMTNREIGAAMFISPATVKTHLSHVYYKLSVRNRAELAAEVARRMPGD